MAIGKHIIVDLFDVSDFFFKSDLVQFDSMVQTTITDHNLHILCTRHHVFEGPPGAVTIFYLLSESHLSIHTWPEKNYIALDVFTCGGCDTHGIVEDVLRFIKPGDVKIQCIDRG